MLTADQFDELLKPISTLLESYQQSVLNDISRRLSKMKMTGTAAWQVNRLNESGMLFEDIMEKLSGLTGQSEEALTVAFEEAGATSIKYDDAIYRAAGLNPVPLNLSPAMLRVLDAGIRKTNNTLQNLTLSTAMYGQEAFINAADLAYMQVTTGAFSYDQAIRQAIKDVAEKGLSTINYASGRVDQLDVAVRRAVLTGVAQTTGEVQMARMDELGIDLVEVSAHAGARTGVGIANHAAWQGKVYSRSGARGKYKDFVTETGYGSGAGLAGWNCRHSFYPFIEGFSQRKYTQKELDEINNKTVELNGKEISQYEASQIQRSLERNIRKYKRQASALESAGLDNTAELSNIRKYQAELRTFVKETKLYRQPAREQIN